MGHFYTNATLKVPDHVAVARAIQRMGRVAAVASACGLTVVFDRESERQDGSAYPFLEELTKEFGCVALYVTNHDDSVLYYRLYESGDVTDDYDSCPNYFEGYPVPPEGGDAAVLCNAFELPSALPRIHEVLRYDRHATENEPTGRYVFEVDRHMDLAQALRLPLIAVGYGYTYLAQERWPDGLSPDNIILVR